MVARPRAGAGAGAGVAVAAAASTAAAAAAAAECAGALRVRVRAAWMPLHRCGPPPTRIKLVADQISRALFNLLFAIFSSKLKVERFSGMFLRRNLNLI